MTETMTPEEYKKAVAEEKRTRWEKLLLTQALQAGLPEPVWGYRGLYDIPGLRNKPFDLAWPEVKLLVEINGGEWSTARGGTAQRHARGQGMIDDYNKWNTATLHGWRVLLFTGTQVRDGTAMLVLLGVLLP